MGRGPVCGMMTRRTGGPDGAGASTTGSAAETAGASATGAAGSGAGATIGAGDGIAGAAASTGGAVGGTNFVAGGATTGTACAGATDMGGRAITGPTGGLLAMAGAAAGTTMLACGRGCGTMRRGSDVAWGCDAGVAAVKEAALGAAAEAAGTEAGGATTAVGRGGAALAAASACLRSRMALSASPGLETLERSNFGLLSTGCLVAELLLPPFLKYSRTLSAWSASMELEWVFPVTPIASSASRIGLLLTSSSRARSLIRTLLIRPFSVSLRP